MTAKPPSQRQLRVGEEVRHVLANTLERGELRDPGLGSAPITVTEVRISPDLKAATAYVVRLGGGQGGDPAADAEMLAALKRASPYLRRQVAKSMALRYAPRLMFALDTTFDQAGHINSLLHDPHVAQDLTGPGPGPDIEPQDGP